MTEKVMVGYAQDELDLSTRKYVIIAETIDGKYVVIDSPLGAQKIISKDKFRDVHEETI